MPGPEQLPDQWNGWGRIQDSTPYGGVDEKGGVVAGVGGRKVGADDKKPLD